MAAGTVTYEKRASVSGEGQHVVKIGILGGTAPTDQLGVIEVRINKDIYDQLHADQQAAIAALTITDLLAVSYT